MKNSFITQAMHHNGPNHWGELPDIERINAQLTDVEKKFISSVGSYLAQKGQANRLAITLLHSHFFVSEDELLVESYDSERNLLFTNVVKKKYDAFASSLTPKSWMFTNSESVDWQKNIRILTWISKGDLVQEELSHQDGLLIQALASIFRKHDVTDRFGMAFIGRRPSRGKVWTEGTEHNCRYLVQEQMEIAQVESRNPINTMWEFDSEGRFTVALGCCLRSKDGHTGTIHPWS